MEHSVVTPVCCLAPIQSLPPLTLPGMHPKNPPRAARRGYTGRAVSSVG